jgi:hypothetical protein
MKKTQVFIFFVLGLVLLGSFATLVRAAPATYQFTFNNRTTKDLEVTLLGAQNYIFSAPSLVKTRVDVKPGVYQISYYACGKLNIGTLNMNKDREIKITQCSGLPGASGSSGSGTSAALVNIVLNNKTYKQLTVALVGVENYSFDLPPGKTFAQVYKGTYQMSYYDCGKLNFSTVKITKDGFQAKIYGCGNVTDEGSTGGTVSTTSTSTNPNAVRFFVKNDTYSSFDLLFLSDLVYTYHIIPGKNKIDIQPGYYQYSYYACGELWIGHIRITRKDQDLFISSCSSGSGRPDTGQNITFKVKNLTGDRFTITFDGPQSYSLLVRKGASTLFSVEKGYYKFQYFVCGKTVVGEIFLRDGVTLKTIPCPGNK